MKIFIFSDGSGAKDTIGTWGACVVTPTMKKALYGVCVPSTIARMELTPIIEALRWTRKHVLNGAVGIAEIVIVSDSQSTVKMMSKESEPHRNKELWSAFWKASEGMQLTVIWRQRNTSPYMELCDSMAFALRELMKDLKTKFEAIPLPQVDPNTIIEYTGTDAITSLLPDVVNKG